MDNDNISKILIEYDQRKNLYADFTERCESLVKELLSIEQHRVHSVSSRLKGREELEDKLRREGKQYSGLGDVTDISGVRVITHFEDEVDKAATLLEREFSVDPKRSIDKRKLLDPDRFGYLSLHYICALHADRLKLAENRRYAGLVCELQIRSILQHAWAEIEHDLGYKPASIVPSPIRRRFCRLAGLLEIADQEFESIRDELGSYAARVADDIKTSPSFVEIDDVSLSAFVHGDPLCLSLDEAMAESEGASLREDEDFHSYVEYLRYAKLVSIEELRRELHAESEVILCQFKRRTGSTPKGSYVFRGLCLLHLTQVILARVGVAELASFFEKFNFAADDEKTEHIVEVIRQCSKR